jgi:DNA-binding protein Fis
MHTSSGTEAQALVVLRCLSPARSADSDDAGLNDPTESPYSGACSPATARTRPESIRVLNDAVAALERAASVLRIGALVAEWESLDIKGGIDLYGEVRRFETWLIKRALHETGGNQTRAARLLGLNKTTLHEKMKRYEIS